MYHLAVLGAERNPGGVPSGVTLLPRGSPLGITRTAGEYGVI